VRALIGELKGPPEHPEAVPYAEFVKTWVPVIFECRERQCLKIDRITPDEGEPDPLEEPKEIPDHLEMSSFGELLPKLQVPLSDIEDRFPLFGKPDEKDPFSESSSKRLSSKRLSNVGSRRASLSKESPSKESPSQAGSKRQSTIRRASTMPSASKTTPEQQKIMDKLIAIDPNLRRPSRIVMSKMTEPTRQVCERVAETRRLLRIVPAPHSDSDPDSPKAISDPGSPKNNP
jgi:hypothetical protein